MYCRLILGFLVTTMCLSRHATAQTAEEILLRCRDKTAALQGGRFSFLKRMKGLTLQDTTTSKIDFSFIRFPADPIPMLFYSDYWNGGKITHRMCYTGTSLIQMSECDSIARIKYFDRGLHGGELLSHQYTGPFAVLQSGFSQVSGNPELLGQETIRGQKCAHLRFTHVKGSPEETLHVIEATTDLWINTEDILVQEVSDGRFKVNGDTLEQYIHMTLLSYDFNTTPDPAAFSEASIPSYYRKGDYIPAPKVLPLEAGEYAPAFDLKSVTGERYSLHQFSGQVVLLDFFYQQCGLCLLSFPILQTLQDKYKDRGLQVLSIDPYDPASANWPEFIQRHHLSHPVLLGTPETEKAYHIDGYPGFVIIHRDGTVAYVSSGYTSRLHEKLDRAVSQALDRQ